jgi:flavin-dependent dehydrogenase
MGEKWITEPERKTRIVYDVDVAVVGGGTAGAVAAIAAARTGASTVLAEEFGTLGGCPTVGRCAHIGQRFFDDDMRQLIDGNLSK